MKIGPATPKSPTDFFALNLARARVEAIVVTGAVLRSEPRLTYDLLGEGSLPQALHEFRREVCGLRTPPRLVVLSRGNVPPDHPVWNSWARPAVFTSKVRADSVRRAGLPGRVDVVGVDAPSMEAAVDYLYREGCRAVSVEAGPSASVALYDAQRITEVMLSVFEGTIDERLIAGEMRDPSRNPDFRASHDPYTVKEASGTWTFCQYVRA